MLPTDTLSKNVTVLINDSHLYDIIIYYMDQTLPLQGPATQLTNKLLTLQTS